MTVLVKSAPSPLPRAHVMAAIAETVVMAKPGMVRANEVNHAHPDWVMWHFVPNDTHKMRHKLRCASSPRKRMGRC